MMPQSRAIAAHPSGQFLSDAGLGKHDLVYVTNSNWRVTVYRYWQRTYAEQLTDLRGPVGACAAFSGEVFITDPGHQKIYAYAHGGSSPISVLDDSGGASAACAVARSSGDVAVANYPQSGESGNIAIYRHGSGKPALFYGNGSHSDQFGGCAYDDRGDLLAVSLYHHSSVWHNDFYYLPRGGKKLALITLPHVGTGGAVQSIQWDGKYWVAGPINNTLYLYSIDSKAHYIGTVSLQWDGTVGAVWIYRSSPNSRGTEVVGVTGDYTSSSSVEYWDYPSGASIGEITYDVVVPLGVTVSLGKH
jgi:hypothetical protein